MTYEAFQKSNHAKILITEIHFCPSAVSIKWKTCKPKMYQNRSSETDSNWVSQRYQQIIPIELTDFKLQIQAKLVTF
jgi:hypothetical protein